jgi:uncharacterized membrane protein YkgB
MGKAKETVKVDSGLGYVFFMAYIGALIFFIERNIGFWGDVLAFLQAAVWPAYVLYEVLTRLAI